MEGRKDADLTELLHKQLTGDIIGVYYDVYNATSRSYPEYIYERAMEYDLCTKHISCRSQVVYRSSTNQTGWCTLARLLVAEQSLSI